MRFESMEFNNKISFLHRIHRMLNREIFNNELKDVLIDIRNLNKDPNKERCVAMYCKAESYQPERILFDYRFEDNYIASSRTQKEQAVLITQIMLHEMIHQYCAQKGIDDTAHSEAWQQKAEEHGLHSTYKDGNNAEEWLKPDVKALVDDLRIH